MGTEHWNVARTGGTLMLYPKMKTLYELKPGKNERKWSCTEGKILAETAALHHLPLEDLVFTEKIDGTCAWIKLNQDAMFSKVGSKSKACEFSIYICTTLKTNGELIAKDNNDKFHIEMANQLMGTFNNMDDGLRMVLGDVTIFGELCGPKIQKGGVYFTERRFIVFDIYDLKTNKFFTWPAVVHFCEELGLEHVPVIDYAGWYNAVVDSGHDIYKPLAPELIKERLRTLKSAYNPDHTAEGMVIRHKNDTTVEKRYVAKIRKRDFNYEDK